MLSRAKKAFDELKHLLDSCGLEESSHKAVPPSTRMEVLGIICDTDKLVLEIPDDKLKDIHRILLCWIDKIFAKLKEIQSLVGKLNFIASCVKPDRIFMSRLLNWLRDVYGQSSNISVPTLVQKDIKWWLSVLPLYNGISMMCEEWCRSDDIFFQ